MQRRQMKRRTWKQAEKWKCYYKRHRELNCQIRNAASDILKSENFISTKEFIQHGNVTVNTHSINVAKYSLAISEKLNIPCQKEELIRGALLHDYFLYDWHYQDKENPHRLHGFFHPGTALSNASKEYSLTKREADIIKKHMWPLTIVPPMCREAWIVTMADKWCSLMETIHLHRGHGAVIPNKQKS